MAGLDMHGQVGETIGGKPVFGVLSQTQIRDWILDKINEFKDGKNMPRASAAGRCAGKFQENKGKHTPGLFDGKAIKHRSAGKKSASDNSKCTIFYIVADEANSVGKIIGVGHHTSASTYSIMWKRSGWLIGNTIDLNDEEND
jgi:hypothetical protein